MAELVREVNFSRLATPRKPEIRVLGSGIVARFFGEGNGVVDLITFGVERLSSLVEGQPDGSFCLLDSPDKKLKSVFYNPDGVLPFDCSPANSSLRKILEELDGSGVSFFQISPIESLGMSIGHSRQAATAFWLFQSQVKQDFERQTGIPQTAAFRVEGGINQADIVHGRTLDVGPLVTGDFDVLRVGWDRAGITQKTAQPQVTGPPEKKFRLESLPVRVFNQEIYEARIREGLQLTPT